MSLSNSKHNLRQNLNALALSKEWSQISVFEIGCQYYDLQQYSSAFTFFLRAVSESDKAGLYYKTRALFYAGLCLYHQGNRDNSARILITEAIMLWESNAPAYYYFYLSLVLERLKLMHDCYFWASKGCKVHGINSEFEMYPGPYALQFQKALAAYWIGKCDEARLILQNLKTRDVNENYYQVIQSNLLRIGSSANTFQPYDQSQWDKLIYQFPGSATIKKNFSQTFQDLFVLTMTKGKRNGLYLEIGCADPFYGNNTALLETEFNWTGISIDIKEEEIAKYRGNRKTLALVRDALSIDYEKLMNSFSTAVDWDYLQIDCEPPYNSLTILRSIPFETHRFAVITFEHDYYADFIGDVREKSRTVLESHGYQLVVPDVAPDHIGTYEDWWIHPKLVSAEIVDFIKKNKGNVNAAETILFKS